MQSGVINKNIQYQEQWSRHRLKTLIDLKQLMLANTVSIMKNDYDTDWKLFWFKTILINTLSQYQEKCRKGIGNF